MEEITRLIHHYREWFYLITIAWTFFEGETFVLLAGAVCANGLIDPYKLTACAWIGSYMGDQCWFFLGRKCGPLLLRRFPDWQHGIDMVHRWLERWDTIFILTFRFIYGIRNFSSVAIGLSDFGVDWRPIELPFNGLKCIPKVAQRDAIDLRVLKDRSRYWSIWIS